MAVSWAAPAPAAVRVSIEASKIEARFARLLAEYAPALARLAACYEADPHHREDLLQDIALALWTALPRFRGECSERTFVYRIAHNRAHTHRARTATPQVALADASDLPDPRPGPDAVAAYRARRERLMTAVRTLPPGQREVVMLRLEGLGNAEIGEVLGVSANAVGVRLNRALAGLRERLDAEDAP